MIRSTAASGRWTAWRGTAGLLPGLIAAAAAVPALAHADELYMISGNDVELEDLAGRLDGDCAQLGRIPAKQEYLAIAAEKIDPKGADLYRYHNFDQIEGFEDSGRVVSAAEAVQVLAGV